MPLEFHGAIRAGLGRLARSESVPERDRRCAALDRRADLRLGLRLPVHHRLLRRRLCAALDGARLVGAVRSRFGETGLASTSTARRLLDPRRIVQIDRNPGIAAHGTSAIRAYAQVAWGLLAAGNQSMTVNQGGIPQAVLKSQRKLTKEQAEALQTQWARGDDQPRRAAAGAAARARLRRRSRSTRPTWRCWTRRSSTRRCSPRPSACRR